MTDDIVSPLVAIVQLELGVGRRFSKCLRFPSDVMWLVKKTTQIMEAVLYELFAEYAMTHLRSSSQENNCFLLPLGLNFRFSFTKSIDSRLEYLLRMLVFLIIVRSPGVRRHTVFS